MAEIKKDLLRLNEHHTYTPSGEVYVITEDHSINDVVRWVLRQLQDDKSELEYLLKTIN